MDGVDFPTTHLVFYSVRFDELIFFHVTKDLRLDFTRPLCPQFTDPEWWNVVASAHNGTLEEYLGLELVATFWE